MTMCDSEPLEKSFGWFYYKKGRYFGVTKNHYLPKGKRQTLCGNHVVETGDLPFLRFTDVNDLFKHKLCKTCLYLANTKSQIS